MQACPGVQWAIPTTAAEPLVINAGVAASSSSALALYLFNPSYLLSSYAANTARVQSATLRIRSATATQWTTIRNLSAIESSMGYMSLDKDAATGDNRKLSLTADPISSSQGIWYLQVGGWHGPWHV